MKRLVCLLCALCIAHPALAQQVLGGNSAGSPPVASVGGEASWFLDVSSGSVYGPKSFGAWPATPTIPAIRGSTAGAAPCTGCVGEEIESSIDSASAVSFTSTVSGNITSVALTAGNWFCYGVTITKPAGSTTSTHLATALNTTSATLPTAPNDGSYFDHTFALGAGVSTAETAGQRVFRTATPITVYLVANVTFAVSTMGLYGYLGCFRQP